MAAAARIGLFRCIRFRIELFRGNANGHFRLCGMHESHQRNHAGIDEPRENRENDDQSCKRRHFLFESPLSASALGSIILQLKPL
jgi:hypothetical protein